MAAPSYTTDLQTIDLCDSGSTYEEFSGYTLGDGADVETDWYIQGTECASDENNNKTGVGHSIGVDYGSTVSFSTGDCFFVWMYYLLPNAVDTFDNGGYRVLIGDSISDFKGWKVGGSDFGRKPYGGWQNFAVDPTYTADYTTGSPDGTYRHFAAAYKCVKGSLKGRPVCADAMRYGRGEIKIEYGDVSNGYGTFSGIASQNDSQSNRWGLFQEVAGGYLWKGLLSFGNATNACDFRDSNVYITVDETPRTYTAFNKIEINNTSSRVDWTGVSITAVNASQLSRGRLEVVDNADVNFDLCTFTDMDTFIFQSNSVIENTTFRRCSQVTQGDGTFSGCTFENSDAAVSLYVSDLDKISNCGFISDGTNHAIELSSAHAGNSYTLTGCTYTNYASVDGNTGNECIYNNSGGAVTININGGDTPSVRNGSGASTTIISGAVTVKVTTKTSSGSIISSARVLVKASSGTGPFPYEESVTISNSGTTATVTHTSHGMATGDKVLIEGASLQANNGVFSITKINDNSYSYTMSSSPGSSPTGTITSTFVALSGITDANGEISTSRVYSSDQPVNGWARKSSSSPFYKSAPISATIDHSNGMDYTAILILDE